MNKEQLMEALRLTVAKPVAVYVPEWKAVDSGIIHILPNMVGDMWENASDQTAERERLKAQGMSDKEIQKRMGARQIAKSICNENGDRIGDPDNEEQVTLIATQMSRSFSKVLNAITGTAEEEEEKDAGKSNGATS